jgi:5-methylcytosine-specific restriction endonuclease McrA
MSKIYLIVPFENKNQAKKIVEKFENIIDEDNNSHLFIDLIPKTCWFSNIRSYIYNEYWLRIRKYIYERVNYKCQCCGLYSKNKTEFNELDSENELDRENELDSDDEMMMN